MTVEEVRGSLDLTDNGAIKNSIRNCLTVFQNDPVLQGAVRYNILTERIDIVKPLWWSKQTATLTDTDLNYLMLYETHPADRLRQCVFGGSSNTMDFLPLDRSGNRRFLPIMVHPENAEIHILEDEAASRAFIDMMWAEVMFIYQNFPVKLTLSKDMDKELKELQKQFMPEDTKAGLIQSFLDNFKGTQVCSKLIYAEALNHPFDEPKQWEIREINEIMNNSIEGWRPFSNPRSFAKYGRQRGWERIPPPDNEPSATGSNLTDGFRELTEEEARQMELPF